MAMYYCTFAHTRTRVDTFASGVDDLQWTERSQKVFNKPNKWQTTSAIQKTSIASIRASSQREKVERNEVILFF